MADLFAPDSRRPSPEPNPQRKKKRGPRDRGAPVWLSVDLARVQVTYDEYGNATSARLAAYMLDTGKSEKCGVRISGVSLADVSTRDGRSPPKRTRAGSPCWVDSLRADDLPQQAPTRGGTRDKARLNGRDASVAAPLVQGFIRVPFPGD